jgi:hypothetical protein
MVREADEFEQLRLRSRVDEKKRLCITMSKKAKWAEPRDMVTTRLWRSPPQLRLPGDILTGTLNVSTLSSQARLLKRTGYF